LDEYPLDGEPKFHFINGKWEANRCSLAIKGEYHSMSTLVREIGDEFVSGETICPGPESPIEDCEFEDDPNQQGSFASFMYKQHLPQVFTAFTKYVFIQMNVITQTDSRIL
jgi:hypothetical protein